MNSRNLPHHVKQHYENQKLSDRRLAELRSLVGESAAASEPDSFSSKHLRWAVAVVLMVGAGIYFFPFTSADITKRVVNEIAKNHNKGLDVEFTSSDLAELQSNLSKLDFQLVASSRLDARGLAVVGARYCSVQGELAAQLRLQDEKGRIWTLYECRQTEELDEVHESSTTVAGVTVELWSEAGVFLGLAGPAQPGSQP